MNKYLWISVILSCIGLVLLIIWSNTDLAMVSKLFLWSLLSIIYGIIFLVKGLIERGDTRIYEIEGQAIGINNYLWITAILTCVGLVQLIIWSTTVQVAGSKLFFGSMIWMIYGIVYLAKGLFQGEDSLIFVNGNYRNIAGGATMSIVGYLLFLWWASRVYTMLDMGRIVFYAGVFMIFGLIILVIGLFRLDE